MITKYNNYIKESFKETFKEYMIIYNFIDNYLKQNNVKSLFKLSEFKYEDDNIIRLEVSFNKFKILVINISTFFNVVTLKNIEKTIFSDINELINNIKDYFDNFYTYLYDYNIYGEYNISVKINNIPIIDVDKYMDFLEVIYLNYKKNNIKAFKKYNDLLDEYRQEFETDIILKKYKNEFYKKFGHLLNAKNFDLI